MNKTTRPLDNDEVIGLISTIKSGYITIDENTKKPIKRRGNDKIAFALYLESVLGIRISDILNLSLSSFQKRNGEMYIVIKEKKTKKQRVFVVPDNVYSSILNYCITHSINDREEKLFKFGARAVQKSIENACQYLRLVDGSISTHSFRKYFATTCYNNSNNNLLLCQQLLQHYSAQTTQKYININSQEVKNVLNSVSFNLKID